MKITLNFTEESLNTILQKVGVPTTPYNRKVLLKELELKAYCALHDGTFEEELKKDVKRGNHDFDMGWEYKGVKK